MLIPPTLSKTALFGGLHVRSKGALGFIYGDDVGGKHRDEDAAFDHAVLFWFIDPIDLFIDFAYVGVGVCVGKEVL